MAQAILPRTQSTPPLFGWRETIRLVGVFTDGADFREARDAVVSAVQGSDWFAQASADEFGELSIWVGQLEVAETPEDFDDALERVYEIAEVDRIRFEQ